MNVTTEQLIVTTMPRVTTQMDRIHAPVTQDISAMGQYVKVHDFISSTYFIYQFDYAFRFSC